MADPPVYYPRTEPGESGGPEPAPRPGTPRWVKVFGIIALILVVLVVLMLTGVLGEGHGPGRHLGGDRGAMPHESTSRAGGPADASEAARTVEIAALDALAFQPDKITVSAGETVTFVVTNTGRAGHEFTLGDPAMQQEHSQAMSHMPAGMAHDTANSIVVPPGDTKQLTWRFGDIATLEYACHVRGHYEAGMRGQITIN